MIEGKDRFPLPDQVKGGRPLLFLDFDGVLHTSDGQRFARLPVLIDALEGSQCDIVVSSSWRHHLEVVELATYLGTLAPRVIGATPALTFRRQDDSGPDHIRQLEVERWMQLNTTTPRAFLVVDDDASAFEPEWPPLLLVDPMHGLTRTDGQRIRHWLGGLG